MSRVILKAGLNRAVIKKKWRTIKEAFEDFSVNKVSNFNSNDVERLLLDKGVVRNRNKIEGIIINAGQFKKNPSAVWRVSAVFGQFGQVKQLCKRCQIVNSKLQKVR